ncbi:DUF721 domain-containing protein [Patescibacteria group bacterium]|nr:DUF721 domain-containing protein [Patescibacteria group bacterium]
MNKIDKALSRQLKKYKIEDKVKAQQLLIAWEKIISDFLPNAARQTMAYAYERGVMKIAVLSREIAYEINLYAKRIMDALNSIVGKHLVYSIVCEY